MKRFTLVMLLALAGCPTADTVEETCHRAQECNYLGSGASESDCVDYFHRCTDKLTRSQRNDWERMMGTCLENESCSLFGSCYAQVPWC